jgi:septal ring factor EnvC (AmiA/AmiB activator)
VRCSAGWQSTWLATPGTIFRRSRVCLLSLMLAFIPPGATADDIAVQSEKLQQLRQHIHDITTEIESMHGQRNDLQAALGKTEKDIGNVAAELHQLDADAAATSLKIQTLNNERIEERQTLAALRQTLERDLRSAYTSGRQQRIKLLLNQQEPALIGRMMNYHGYFTRARAARLQKLRATLARIDGIEHALVEQQADIKQLRLQQREKSQQLEAEQLKQRKLLAQLQRDMQVKKIELSTLQQDEQRLQSLVQSLQQAMRDVAPEDGEFISLRHFKGKLHWPVAGRITRRYGTTHSFGGLQYRGVHIAARAGADVHAIAAGRVAFADWLRGFGLLLIIDHGDGYMSLYGQNRSLYKDVGDWVKRGDVVASTGSSGGQQQDGLYLELRKDGQPFNPTAWFDGQPLSPQANSR